MATFSWKAEPRGNFELLKTLESGIEVVVQKGDGASYLSRPAFDQPDDDDKEKAKTLFSRGAHRALFDLLNHENLVSVAATTAYQPVSTRGNDAPDNRVLWDHCDAGTLAQLLHDYRAPIGGPRYLPEGLVWHVGISILRALQWLHEGIRDTYQTEPENSIISPPTGRPRRFRGQTPAEIDWLPVIHRAVLPENIFFQLPRGVETYGTCKLGNFADCYVSGQVSASELPVMYPRVGTRKMPLDTMRDTWADMQAAAWAMPQDERPFARGCELSDLGMILHNMMTGYRLPSREMCEFCNCYHFDENATLGRPCWHNDCPYWNNNAPWRVTSCVDEQKGYSTELRKFVLDLLYSWRSDTRASLVLNKHWPGYQDWMQNTVEGRQHRDIFDDIHVRKANSNIRHMESLQVARETMGVDIQSTVV